MHFDDRLFDPRPMRWLDSGQDFMLRTLGIDLEQIDPFEFLVVDDPGECLKPTPNFFTPLVDPANRLGQRVP